MSFLDRMRALAETELVSQRLVLEPLRPAHAEGLLAGLQDERLYKFIPQVPPADLAWLTARFERICARGPADGGAVWLNWALRRRDRRYCGLFEATATPDGRVDIAYFVFAADQRQGLAGEAAGTVVAALLDDPGLLLIGATLDTRNQASARLVEALGFAWVATVKDAAFFDGAASDEYRYELTPGRDGVVGAVPSRPGPR